MAICSPNIDNCIEEFLFTLTLPELSSLRAVISSVLTVVGVLITLLTSRLAQLTLLQDIYTLLLSPITAAQQALLSGLNILPLTRLPECIGLGEFIFNLRDIIGRVDPRISAIEDLLNGLDNQIAKIGADIQRYTDFESFANDVIECIDKAILAIQQSGT